MDFPSQLSSAFSFDDASQDLPSTNPTPSQTEHSSGTYYHAPIIETERVKVIWGTTINIQDMLEQFKEFLRTTIKDDKLYYMDRIEEMHATEDYKLDLDCTDLRGSLIYDQLQRYPQEALPILEQAVAEILVENHPEVAPTIHIRPNNIGTPVAIRNLDPRDIDRIVEVRGLVIRSSAVIPEVVKAYYECIRCNKAILSETIKNTINEPVNCDCGGRFTFKLIHNKGEYVDKQLVRIQELPEHIPDGTTPMTLTVVCMGGLVDSLVPGDKVALTGVLRAAPVRINTISRKVKTSFRSFLDLLSVSKEREKVKEVNLSLLDSLRTNPRVYEILASSIAPSVYGMENVKKALLLQLVGGVRKEATNTRFRGDINVLLAGDPGVSKSQLLSFIHRVCGRGMYTSGRGSSAVGLTAHVTKDPDSKQFVLEPGALVLSDNGICCVDEFDKMNESTRSVLHEVMEQQTVSVAKAGIITTLNARCAILASCNPIESKYNLKKSIVDNINLPSTLLSRFDVICLLVDKNDEVNDRKIGNHIVDLFMEEDELVEGCVSIDTLKRYIEEGKKINPALTPEAKTELREAYCSLRLLDNGKSITATTRQLESLIRLSEAHARIRLSSLVEVEDVTEAVRIIKESLLMYAIDPVTGKLDMDLIMTGKSTHNRKMVEDLKEAICRILKKRTLLSELQENFSDNIKIFNEAIRELQNEEMIYIDKRNNWVEKIQ